MWIRINVIVYGILQIEDEADDKMLCLTEQELLRVLEDQVTSLLRSYPNSQLPVPEFLTAFMRFHGHSIRLQDYNVSSVSELIQQIPAFATVSYNGFYTYTVMCECGRGSTCMGELRR